MSEEERVGTKVDLENRICRAAIVWERTHAENEPTMNDEVHSADVALAGAVQTYRRYLVEEALPVDEKEAEEGS